jgi:hypothetical protein
LTSHRENAQVKRLLAEAVISFFVSWLTVHGAVVMMAIRVNWLNWLIARFLLPGFFVGAKLFPSQYFGHTDGDAPNMKLALTLDSVFLWIVLMLGLAMTKF